MPWERRNRYYGVVRLHNSGHFCAILGASMLGPSVARSAPGTLAGRSAWLGQASHYGAQAEVARQVGGEASHAEGLTGVEDDLASRQMREDGAGGVDRDLASEADEALAPFRLLIAHRVEVRLPGPGTTDRQ